MIFQSLACGLVVPVVSHIVQRISLNKILFSILEMHCWSSPHRHSMRNQAPREKSSLRRYPEKNQWTQAHLQHLGARCLHQRDLRKVTWDLAELEIQQEWLISTCRSKGPYGTAHLCSTGRNYEPRRTLFLAQRTSVVRREGWEGST